MPPVGLPNSLGAFPVAVSSRYRKDWKALPKKRQAKWPPPFLEPRKLRDPFGPINYPRNHIHSRTKHPQKHTMERTINMQSFGSGNINCRNLTNSDNKTITANKTDDEDHQIKQWLSPLAPRYRYQSEQASRVDGMGSWLLEKRRFLMLSGSQVVAEQIVLFCYGHPCIRKTHIRWAGDLSWTSGYPWWLAILG